MDRVLLIGGGKIGRMIARLLGDSGDYAVTVADSSAAALERFGRLGFGTVTLDAADGSALAQAMEGVGFVVNATPFYLTEGIATAAAAAGAHYFDLTEDVASTRAVHRIAEDATSVLMPQCGLAPGFVSIAGAALAARFDRLQDLSLRVGALPLYPTNALKYNLTWSTDGLINEYLNPCEAIVDGEYRETEPLEGYEHFSLDGAGYEAFNTSGGLGTLHETLDGRVRNLSYRTIRYPGHLDVIKLLLNDLKLRDRRDMLKDILETAIPMTTQDVVLVFVTASGYRKGVFIQDSYVNKVFGHEVDDEPWSAIQITTAAAVCAVLDLVATGALPDRGFLRQEQVALDAFLENRFGRYYVDGSGPG